MAEHEDFLGLVMVGRLGNHIGTLATALSYSWDHGLPLICPQLANLPLPKQVDLILEPAKQHFLPNTFYWPRMCNDYLPVYERLLGEYPDIARPLPEQRIVNYLIHLEHAYKDYKITANAVLVGYFFNEKYFIHHKDRIKALFQPTDNLLAYINHKYGAILNNPKSVGIHYRDFTNDGDTWVIKLSQRHFLEAIEHFDDSHTFYVCSNKINNAKPFFDEVFAQTKKEVRYIENERDFIDFYFLTRLKNLIISNSSFGWWVAYLCNHPDKTILAPHRDKWVLPQYLEDQLVFMPESEQWTVV